MEKTIAAISTARRRGDWHCAPLRTGGVLHWGKGVPGRQREGPLPDEGLHRPAGGRLRRRRGAAGRRGGLVFRAPKSYTGEDVVELSCHGGLYVTKRLLQAVLDAGASPAGPGEFTRRAFVNGKLDLAQAEAVMGLIGASGEQARRAAQAGSSGVLSQRISRVRENLLTLAAHLAAWADFPEEDVPQVEEGELLSSMEAAQQEISSLLAGFDRGKMYREGLATVIAAGPTRENPP